MKKTQTTYSTNKFSITVNNEIPEDHISIHDGGEPCSGVLRHWGRPQKLIEELEEMITVIKDIRKWNKCNHEIVAVRDSKVGARVYCKKCGLEGGNGEDQAGGIKVL